MNTRRRLGKKSETKEAKAAATVANFAVVTVTLKFSVFIL